jgi:hypothetical protein
MIVHQAASPSGSIYDLWLDVDRPQSKRYNLRFEAAT